MPKPSRVRTLQPRIEGGLGGDRPDAIDPEDAPPRDLGARCSWTGCSASTRDCPGRRHRAADGHARRAAHRVHHDGRWPQAHRRDAPALTGGGQRDPPGGSPTRTAPVPQRPNSAWSGGSSVTSNDQLLNLLNEHPGVRDARHHGIALNRGVVSPSRPRRSAGMSPTRRGPTSNSPTGRRRSSAVSALSRVIRV